MANIRIGFIGCGAHSGTRLYPSLRPAGLDLVAVCDLDEHKAAARAEEYNVPHYIDYGAMCDSEAMDAVLVCVGPQAHRDLAVPLVERGYHVWTEKPPSYTAAQADEVAEAAGRAGRLVQTGFNYRYTLGIQKAARMVACGRFGTPGMVAVRWWLGVPDPLEFMHHYIVHAADLLNYLTPGDLTGMHVEHHRRDEFDYYLVSFRAGDGCIAVLEVSANMALSTHWCRVDWMSKDGILSVRDFTEVTHHGTERWGRYADPDSPRYDGDRVWRTEPLIARGPFGEVWGYALELDRFRQAVLGEIEPEATIREAAWSMRVCEALMSAADHERP